MFSKIYAMQSNYIYFGKIVASHKFSHQLIVIHQEIDKKNISKLKVFFIEKDKQFIPYFFKSIQHRSQEESIITIEDVENFDSAKDFLKQKIFLLEKTFNQLINKIDDQLINFLLYNQENQLLGKIIHSEETNKQFLTTILYKNKEVLIPLHEKIILNINNQQKTIQVDIPDGLLEL